MMWAQDRFDTEEEKVLLNYYPNSLFEKEMEIDASKIHGVDLWWAVEYICTSTGSVSCAKMMFSSIPGLYS